MHATFLSMSLLMSRGIAAPTPPPVPAPRTIADARQRISTEQDSARKFYRLSDLMALYAAKPLSDFGEDEAKTAAHHLLRDSQSYAKDWNFGNAVHHSHLVLGRIELHHGRIDAAKAELEAAGKTLGSPQLNSFGPNMTLAKELLEQGETVAVLKYFELCRVFWKSEFADPKIKGWTADIEAGRTPDFSGNLVY